MWQILRLEGQVTRYKTAADAAEKVEDELKVEKRKLQREVTFDMQLCNSIQCFKTFYSI